VSTNKGTEGCKVRAMTRDGEAWQWVVVHVAGNGDCRYDVHPGRAEACEARDRRGNAPSGRLGRRTEETGDACCHSVRGWR
jgi:hypothetical protein